MPRHLSLYRVMIATLALPLALAGCGIVEQDPLEAGKQAFAENNFADARIHLLNAIKAEPTSAEANLLFARTLLELGDGLGAENALSKVKASGDLSDDALVRLRARANILQGKYREALDMLEAAPSEGQAEWHRLMARALFESGDFTAASTRLSNGLTLHGDDAGLLALSAALAIEQGRVSEARSQIAKALKAEPDNLEALLIRGQLALFENDLEAAEESFSAALQAYPDSVFPLISMAAIQADNQDYDAALDYLDRADAMANVQPVSVYLRARIAFAQDDVQTAYNLMQETGDVLDDHPPSVLLSGEIAIRQGNFNQAEQRLSRFVKLFPNHTKGAFLLAEAREKQGDAKGALQAVRQVIDRADVDPQLLGYAAKLAGKAGDDDLSARLERRAEVPKLDNLGEQLIAAQAALAEGRPNDALTIYEALIGKGMADNALVRNNAAQAALQANNNKRALNHARAAMDLAPDDPAVQDTLAWVMLNSGGDKVEALELLRSASMAKPADMEIRWHLAQALIANKQNAAAKREIEVILPFVRPEQRNRLEQVAASL
ncbi:tetratricopeptide repeat protein [Alterisphingorhabdus coralli]|uniref:Tetratricopeptide repeat protein n=1 Tax=Alterisphingorhabdus coralli TaxID=3071408 RepID=A0AA97I0I3_9SPHN|nr:tetratricopeptide repeat protein [Parasphingorhabdus sp. SCSIO 66989]WOE74418.1 tetratricopeptide repeat protein [Parasphingorhabdus sp. SCSIO 66989]